MRILIFPAAADFAINFLVLPLTTLVFAGDTANAGRRIMLSRLVFPLPDVALYAVCCFVLSGEVFPLASDARNARRIGRLVFDVRTASVKASIASACRRLRRDCSCRALRLGAAGAIFARKTPRTATDTGCCGIAKLTRRTNRARCGRVQVEVGF